MDAGCKTCCYSTFDSVWGEYKCKKKGRKCTAADLESGCSDYKKQDGEPDTSIPVTPSRPTVPDDDSSDTDDEDIPVPEPGDVTDAKCENCYYSVFDLQWGEQRCKKHGRTCTISEMAMGCCDYIKNTSKPDDPPPEIVVRSGATYTPSVTDDGILSWTNDKDLPNPKPVNLKPKDGYTPIKGVDYVDGYTPVKGKDYVDGTTYTPAVTEDGVLSWTNNNNLPNPDPVNLKPKDGYTPIKGVDYDDGKDGYTPVKGVDYFDGKDGYTPVKGVDYVDGKDGYTPQKDVDYFDGATYTPSVTEDGVLSWTNDEGLPNPDPVNLKPKDGKDGYTPVKGVDYVDGKTPVKGVDYYTPEEKAELIEEVMATIPLYNGHNGKYQVTPKVESQTMLTKGKIMTDDVTVNPIPYYDVSNTSGGTTIYIGNEV